MDLVSVEMLESSIKIVEKHQSDVIKRRYEECYEMNRLHCSSLQWREVYIELICLKINFVIPMQLPNNYYVGLSWFELAFHQ